MASENPKEVFLTQKQRRYLRGEFLPGSETTRGQSITNYNRRIRQKLKPAVYDFQTLFNHIDQEELEHADAFGEQHEDTGSDPISRQRHDHSFSGHIPDQFVNESGDPVDPDPDVNPDAKHQAEQILDELTGSQKAAPETQEALIDAVALLCRAGEAGELKLTELLERGFERYHENRSERFPGESEKVVKVTERTYGGTHNRARKYEQNGKRLTPAERKVLQLETTRE